MAIVIYNQDKRFDPGKLKRSVYTQERYALKLKKLQEKNITPADFILKELFQAFGWDTVDYEQKLLSFQINEYPLELPENQVHMLLWDKENKLTDMQAKRYIFATYNKAAIESIWKNEEKDQSVKQLSHFHFILTYESN